MRINIPVWLSIKFVCVEGQRGGGGVLLFIFFLGGGTHLKYHTTFNVNFSSLL